MCSFTASSSSIACQPQELVNSSYPSIPVVDLIIDDIILNSITIKIQLYKLSDNKPWKGPKEKLEQLMQFFIIG